MPRPARIVVAGAPHPITERGNNQQDVFVVDDDRRVYPGFPREYAARYRFRVHGYCLMTNPPPADLRSRHLRYSLYIDPFYKRSGHRWQGRFHSCALDATHYGNARWRPPKDWRRDSRLRISKVWVAEHARSAPSTIELGSAADRGVRDPWDADLASYWKRAFPGVSASLGQPVTGNRTVHDRLSMGVVAE